MLLCWICKIFKKNYLEEHLRTAASAFLLFTKSLFSYLPKHFELFLLLHPGAHTTWKVSKYGDFRVRIFPYLYWIRKCDWKCLLLIFLEKKSAENLKEIMKLLWNISLKAFKKLPAPKYLLLLRRSKNN